MFATRGSRNLPGRGSFWAKRVGAADEAEVQSFARMAAEAGVTIECNPRFLRAAPEEAKLLFGTFREEGCTLSINSDAHHPAHIGCRGPAFATEEELRATGIDEECLFRIEERATRALERR